jgi:phosphatidate cytidylyltransferase
LADGESVEVPLAVRTSDLKVRTLSAVVMLAVAGAALWFGGIWLDAFIVAISVATFAEFVALVLKAVERPFYRVAAILAGAVYIGVAAVILVNAFSIVPVIGAVIAVDVFAYFSGRTFGGPKIAPSISPSKTWAGLLGGIVGAGLFFFASSQMGRPPFCQWLYDLTNDPVPPNVASFDGPCTLWYPPIDVQLVLLSLVAGVVFAVAAQSGDFLESWIKRKAGVKDSSKLIPGHGGVFDRTDGMIPVAWVMGIVLWMGW